MTVRGQHRVRARGGAGLPRAEIDGARRGDAGAGEARGHSAKRKPRPAVGRPAAARGAGARAGASARSCCCSTSRSAALDKKLREETQIELMQLQEQLGMTFIIVTHDQEEAMTHGRPHRGDERGRVCRSATPRRDLRAPNSRWVAEFVGDGEHHRRRGGVARRRPRNGRERKQPEQVRLPAPRAGAGDRSGLRCDTPGEDSLVARRGRHPCGQRGRSTAGKASSGISYLGGHTRSIRSGLTRRVC